MGADGAGLRPILISIPHASLVVPSEMRPMLRLADDELRECIDLYTDQVFALRGYHTVIGEICRVIVDVNRAPDDIAKEYHLGEDGVVVQTTQNGKPVYAEQPPDDVMDALIVKYHDPYHDAIDAIMPEVDFLFDCHSYHSIGPALKKDAGQPRPDFNIGNRRYSTCNRTQTIFVRDFFEGHGYSVGINVPYMGGYVLAHHCHRRRIPPFLVPGLQIEINQKLYLNETTYAPLPGKIMEMNRFLQEMVDAFAGEFCAPR